MTTFEILKAVATYYPEARLRIVGETIEVIPPAKTAVAAAPQPAAPLFDQEQEGEAK